MTLVKDAAEQLPHIEEHSVDVDTDADGRQLGRFYTRKTLLYPFAHQDEFLQELGMPRKHWATLPGGKSGYMSDPYEWGAMAGTDAQRKLRQYLDRGKPDRATRDVYEYLLKNNDLDLAARVNRRSVPNARRFVRPCEEGDSVNIERAQQRESDCWECHTFKSTRQRTVSLGINYSSSSSDRALFQKLAASAAVVLGILRSQGYRTRLVGTRIISTSYTDNEADLVGMYWPIIDFGERFDIERVLCWGHNAVFTWFGRVWAYHLYHETHHLVDANWGYAMVAPEIPTGALREAGIDHILYTPTSSGVHMGDIVGSAVKAVGGTF
jgi:hypothetical protein